MEIITRFTDILDLTHMTHVVIHWVVGDDLVDTFLGQLVGLPGLHLKHGSFLLCGQDFGMFRVDVDCLEEMFNFRSVWEKLFEELKDTKNLIFFRYGDV